MCLPAICMQKTNKRPVNLDAWFTGRFVWGEPSVWLFAGGHAVVGFRCRGRFRFAGFIGGDVVA